MTMPSFEEQELATTFHRGTSHSVHAEPAGDATPHGKVAFKEYLEAPRWDLPKPRLPDGPLADALRSRRSCRRFRPDDLAPVQLSTVLHGAYGIVGLSELAGREFLERPVPSAGALYPLELYVLVERVDDLPAGVFHYAPLIHALEQLSARDPSSPSPATLFSAQQHVVEAAAVVVVAARLPLLLHRYGDRGYRYALALTARELVGKVPQH